MDKHTTLTEALVHATRCDRGVVHVTGTNSETALSYAALHARALGLLGHFQQRGLRPGQFVILLFDANEPFIDSFWACLFGGIIAVPIAAGTTTEHARRFGQVVETLASPTVVTTRQSLSRIRGATTDPSLGEKSEPSASYVFLDDIVELPEPGTPHEAGENDIAFVQFSSGSTRTPKGVLLSHRNLLANIYAIIQRAEITAEDRCLSWMPLTHDMGLIGFHLTPLVLGASHIIMATELFVRRPASWLGLASEKHATLLCSPNFGYKHYLRAYRPEQATDLDLRTVRLVFNGAEPISAALAREFCETLAQYGLGTNVMYPVYGLAEASLAVTFPPAGRAIREVFATRASLNIGSTVEIVPNGAENSASFVALGQPIAACRVRVCGDGGQVLAEHQVGHVQIRGESVCGGYYKQPTDDLMFFTADGWLNTGDLGFFDQGELVISGRAKDMLCINGVNYYPSDLEQLVQASTAAEPDKVAVCGVYSPEAATDEIVMFVQYRGDLGTFVDTANTLRAYLSRSTGLEIAEVIPIHRIPRTTSGKVQRHALAQRYASSEFATVCRELARLTVHDAASNELERELQRICKMFMHHKDIGVNDNLLELGESSLTLAMVYEQIEETWPDKLDITDLLDYPTIAELAAFLQAKLSDPDVSPAAANS
jgi:acyl-CoA synthetase (AMP-forming)/AMP-acid ligase II